MEETRGRPSLYSDELADDICKEIADGKSLRSICAKNGMPDKSTVFRWLADNEFFRDQYARAREEQADHYADEIIEIADDSSRDIVIGDDGKEIINHEHIARARLRVDARKWKASKLAPKKYGDKVAHVGGDDGDAPIKFERIERVIIDPETDASDTDAS